MNPITQRSITPSQQNGAAPQPKSNAQRAAINADAGEQERSRMFHLLGTFMVRYSLVTMMVGIWTDPATPLQGHTAIIKTKNGDRFSGIFFGASLEANESSYLMKMVQMLKPVGKGEINGVKDNTEPFVGVGADHAMAFEVKDVNDLTIAGIEIGVRDKLQNGWCLMILGFDLVNRLSRVCNRVSYRRRHIGESSSPGATTPTMGSDYRH